MCVCVCAVSEWIEDIRALFDGLMMSTHNAKATYNLHYNNIHIVLTNLDIKQVHIRFKEHDTTLLTPPLFN